MVVNGLPMPSAAEAGVLDIAAKCPRTAPVGAVLAASWPASSGPPGLGVVTSPAASWWNSSRAASSWGLSSSRVPILATLAAWPGKAGARAAASAAPSRPAADGSPSVYLAGCGAVLPEVLAAAAELADEGIAAHVVDITSADRLYRAWQRTLRQGVRTATAPSIPGALRTVFPDRAPIVTVHDAASHTLSWLGSALGVPAVSLGVDTFGQSGAVADLYRAHDLDAGSIVNAALAALSLR